MPNKLFSALRPTPAGWIAFLIVSVLVFGFVLMTATVVTFIMPEVYASKAVIRISPDTYFPASLTKSQQMQQGHEDSFIKTETVIIQSEVVLDKVIELLDLNRRWSQKFGASVTFKTPDTRMALQRMIEVHEKLPNTSLVDIIAYSEDKQEAAEIANAVAEAYRRYRLDKRRTLVAQAHNQMQEDMAAKGNPSKTEKDRLEAKGILSNLTDDAQVPVEIIEHAEPSLRPVRPNKPLNIFLGGFTGIFAGCIAGGIAAWIVSRMQRKQRVTPPPVPQAV